MGCSLPLPKAAAGEATRKEILLLAERWEGNVADLWGLLQCDKIEATLEER
jgi:hypothetical protein